MKRIRVILLLLLAALLLFGCTKRQTVYTVTRDDGVTFIVDTENKTISDDYYTYSYTIRGDTTTITYPNGAKYYWTWSTSGAFTTGTGGWDNNYDPNTYADGDILIDILSEEAPTVNKKSGNPLMVLLLIALGAFNTFCPRAAWYLSHGWRFKDAEPSDAALMLAKISGVIVMVGAVIYLFA